MGMCKTLSTQPWMGYESFAIYSGKGVLNKEISDPSEICWTFPFSPEKNHVHKFVRTPAEASNTFQVPVTYPVKPDSWLSTPYKGSEELAMLAFPQPAFLLVSQGQEKKQNETEQNPTLTRIS